MKTITHFYIRIVFQFFRQCDNVKKKQSAPNIKKWFNFNKIQYYPPAVMPEAEQLFRFNLCGGTLFAFYTVFTSARSLCNVRHASTGAHTHYERIIQMYLKYYNLKEKPFNISPDSRFLWMSDKHKEALASLKYGVLENKGFLVLTGDIGTGKTLMINALIRISEVKALIATIPDPDLELMDFFMLLAEEFNMPKTFASKGEFLVQFKEFLLESYASDKAVLLIVDEAQRLNTELLEQIRLLSNIELDNHKLLNIFFVGQNEFNQLLRDGRNKAVRQRISVFYQLNPLTESETGAYIRHRLQRAGATEEIFKPNAIRAIFKFSNGTPRLINLICDLALLTGFTRELKKINAEVIKDCDKELQIPMDLVKTTPKPPKPKEDHSALNQAVVQRKEPAGIRGGIIFIGIVFFLFVAFQIYESMTDKPFFWKQGQVETQKKFEPSEDVSAAFQTQKEEIENTKSEDVEPLTTPQKEETR